MPPNSNMPGGGICRFLKCAELLAVVLDHLQCPAKLGGTRGVRVVVRRMRAQGVAQFGVLLQPAQRLMALLDEGVDQGGVIAVANDLPEVGADGLGGVHRTGGAGLIGTVEPHRPAGNRRGAAKVFGLFHHQHFQPMAGGRGGSGKATGTAAQHDQVKVVLRMFMRRHGFRSPAA